VVITVEGVRKRFSRAGRWVLDGVELAIPAGEVTVVAAGNGTGKSTLLRIVAGASSPTAGRVVNRPGVVGYVPERAPVRVRMTARQYIVHMGRLRGLRPDAARARAAELFERLELRPGADVPITELSKGNSQKVAVAQAFLCQPELLVMDEPYTGLDARASREVRGLLTETAAAGTAVLISAHERTAAEGRVFQLREGRVRPRAARRETTMRVVLVAVDGRAAPGDLAGFAADTLAEDGRITLHTTDADGLIGHALANGWSLLEARPEEAR
jgi:ABC-2 type transport system ATP-binding protein